MQPVPQGEVHEGARRWSVWAHRSTRRWVPSLLSCEAQVRRTGAGIVARTCHDGRPSTSQRRAIACRSGLRSADPPPGRVAHGEDHGHGAQAEKARPARVGLRPVRPGAVSRAIRSGSVNSAAGAGARPPQRASTARGSRRAGEEPDNDPGRGAPGQRERYRGSLGTSHGGLLGGWCSPPLSHASPQTVHQASSSSLRLARLVDTFREYMRVTIGSASFPKNPPIVGTSWWNVTLVPPSASSKR